MTKRPNKILSYLKRFVPWLPLIGVLYGVVHYTVESTLLKFANRSLVTKEQYVENQTTQDRRLDKLEAMADKLDERLDSIEKRRR